MGVRARNVQPAPLLLEPHKKSPVTRAFFSRLAPFVTRWLNVDCLIAFRTGGDIEGTFWFPSGTEAAALDRREVGEQILARRPG